MNRLGLPLSDDRISGLKAGDRLLLSGVIYTARDHAHRKIVEIIDSGADLPFDLRGATVYYAGPCPAKPGEVIGSCGPTTSARMNAYAPALLNVGLKCIIGKGEMSDEVVSAIVSNRACYFAAIGGAGALYAKCVKSCECVAFPELLSEAVYRLEVEDFPVVVAIDSFGNSIYGKI